MGGYEICWSDEWEVRVAVDRQTFTLAYLKVQNLFDLLCWSEIVDDIWRLLCEREAKGFVQQIILFQLLTSISTTHKLRQTLKRLPPLTENILASLLPDAR